MRAILLIAMLFGASFGQNEPRRIGSIDFYGYAGLNLEQIRPALPVHEGDQFSDPFDTIEGIKKAVTAVTRPEAAGAITFLSIGATDRDGALAQFTFSRCQNFTRAGCGH